MEEDIIEKCKKSRLPEGEEYIFGEEALLQENIKVLGEKEKSVLRTFKEGYGLTNAEREILLNLIEKQQKEIEKLKKDKQILYGVIDEIKEERN